MSAPYPEWVCLDCGQAAAKKPKATLSTWHQGVCEVCLRVDAVTEPRDFGYPAFPLRFIEARRKAARTTP